jgi:hypothetical protein
MFGTLLNHYWITMPKVLDAGIEKGLAGREPKPEWVPLKGLSAISDLLPPKPMRTLALLMFITSRS